MESIPCCLPLPTGSKVPRMTGPGQRSVLQIAGLHFPGFIYFKGVSRSAHLGTRLLDLPQCTPFPIYGFLSQTTKP